MHDDDFAKFTDDLEAALVQGAATAAILGATPAALRLLA